MQRDLHAAQEGRLELSISHGVFRLRCHTLIAAPPHCSMVVTLSWAEP